VINARLSQIKDSENTKEAKEKSQHELTEYMEECKKKRDLAKSTLEIKKQDIEKKMPGIEKRIANLLELEKQLIENETKTYDKVGLRGDVLVKALKSIRTFSETVGKEASAYGPLKAFLKSI
jgi:site-specific recombinase XerD